MTRLLLGCSSWHRKAQTSHLYSMCAHFAGLCRARPEVMTLGLKTARELCLRCPLIMAPELLQVREGWASGSGRAGGNWWAKGTAQASGLASGGCLG